MNNTNTNAAQSNKLRFSKGRLIENPIGKFVSMPWKNRELLGEVTAVDYNDVRGCYLLTVKHFNGEQWPVAPGACSVNVIRQAA